MVGPLWLWRCNPLDTERARGTLSAAVAAADEALGAGNSVGIAAPVAVALSPVDGVMFSDAERRIGTDEADAEPCGPTGAADAAAAPRLSTGGGATAGANGMVRGAITGLSDVSTGTG